jgi:hypothetical protein
VALAEVGRQFLIPAGTFLGFRSSNNAILFGIQDRYELNNRLRVFPVDQLLSGAFLSSSLELRPTGQDWWSFDPVTGRGDLDADGREELWASEPQVDAQNWFVFPGTTHGEQHQATWTFQHTAYNTDSLPVTIVMAGELDVTPGPDLAVVRRTDVRSRDELLVFRGPFTPGDHALVTPELRIRPDPWSRFGTWAALKDADGDGVEDLWLQVESQTLGTAIVIFRGPLGGDLSTENAWAELASPPAHPDGGRPALLCDTPVLVPLSIGDVDHDGFLDFLVGQPHRDHLRGAAAVFRGPIRGKLDIERPWARFRGDIVAGRVGATGLLADFDGDGSDEIVVGSAGWAENPIVVFDSSSECDPGDTGCPVDTAAPPSVYNPMGSVGVWRLAESGEHEFADANLIVHPSLEHRGFPKGLYAPGDIDGDGHGDLAITHFYDATDGEEVETMDQPVLSIMAPCSAP